MDNLNKIILENRFSNWQKIVIYTKKYGDITINECIRYLVCDNLIPFLSKNNLFLLIRREDFINGIASILFHLYYDSQHCVKLPSDYFDDDFYNYYIDFNDWENFWKSLNNDLDDFLQYNTTATCFQLQDYIYSVLDFDKSPQYLTYIEENYDSEDEEPPKKKKEEIDPYLLENYHHKFVKFDI